MLLLKLCMYRSVYNKEKRSSRWVKYTYNLFSKKTTFSSADQNLGLELFLMEPFYTEITLFLQNHPALFYKLLILHLISINYAL